MDKTKSTKSNKLPVSRSDENLRFQSVQNHRHNNIGMAQSRETFDVASGGKSLRDQRQRGSQ